MAVAHSHRPLLPTRLWLLPVPLLALAAFLVPVRGPTMCPFALLTGTACPGCGLTRAAASLVRGEWAAAFTFHPLVVIVALWLGGAWIAALARARGHQVEFAPRLVNQLLVATGALFVVVWLVRLVSGTLPPV